MVTEIRRKGPITDELMITYMEKLDGNNKLTQVQIGRS